MIHSEEPLDSSPVLVTDFLPVDDDDPDWVAFFIFLVEGALEDAPVSLGPPFPCGLVDIQHRGPGGSSIRPLEGLATEESSVDSKYCDIDDVAGSTNARTTRRPEIVEGVGGRSSVMQYTVTLRNALHSQALFSHSMLHLVLSLAVVTC